MNTGPANTRIEPDAEQGFHDGPSGVEASRSDFLHACKVGLLVAACLSAELTADLRAQQARSWMISPRAEIVIGEAFGDDAYMFQSIAAGTFLPDGRIVIADRGHLEVRIYGTNGKVQTQIGRRGRGPGEFEQISALWLTSEKLIAVWDPDSRRFTLFDHRGRLAGSQRVLSRPEGGNLEVFLGAFSNDEIVLASLYRGQRRAGPNPDRWVLGRFGLDGQFKAGLGEIRGMWRSNGYPVAFSAMPTAAVSRDSIYLTDGYEGQITVRDREGATVRTIQLPQVAKTSAGAVWSSLESQLRRDKKTLFLNYLKDDLVPRENRFPEVGGLLTDDRGNLWVKVYDPYSDSIWLKRNAMWPAPGGEWRVISPEGRLVAVVQMPKALRPLDIAANRLLGVATDDLGVERVVVHGIAR